MHRPRLVCLEVPVDNREGVISGLFITFPKSSTHSVWRAKKDLGQGESTSCCGRDLQEVPGLTLFYCKEVSVAVLSF